MKCIALKYNRCTYISFWNRVQEVNCSLLSVSWDAVWLPVLQNIVWCWCSCSSPNYWLRNCDLWSHEIQRHCWMGVPESLRIAMSSGLQTRAKLHWSTLSGAILYLFKKSIDLVHSHVAIKEAGLSRWWSFCGWKKLCNRPLFKLFQDFLTSNLFPTNNALCFCLYTMSVCMGSLLLAVAGLLNGLFFSYHLIITSSCISLVQLSIMDAVSFEHIIPVS